MTLPKSTPLFKKGALHTSEWETITTLVNSGASLDYISKELGRSVGTIKKFLLQRHISHPEIDDYTPEYMELLIRLHKRNYWPEIIAQFTEEEQRNFEAAWVNLVMQFRDDVLYSEEMQIKQYITLEILINRSMKDRKKHIEEAERLQKILDVEYLKKDNERNMELINSLSQQIAFSRNAVGAYTIEYTKLLEKQRDIGKDLKATREARIKRIEDSKSSFVGYIRMLEEENTRIDVGKNIELMKLAGSKALDRLSDPHVYGDGMEDVPFLTPEIYLDKYTKKPDEEIEDNDN